MKLIFTIPLLVATATFACAEEKSLAEKTKEIARDAKEVVTDAARKAADATEAAWNKTEAAWTKTKAYVGEDPETYRDGANRALADLGGAIATVKTTAPADAPKYFQTRVQSLDEQLEHAKGALAGLTPGEMKFRASGPRYAFDRCVDGLEAAVHDAKSEAESLNKISQK
jgi:ElaB/YqjD/DUF883 family membrane-anchored ribosome-binding protein